MTKNHFGPEQQLLKQTGCTCSGAYVNAAEEQAYKYVYYSEEKQIKNFN